jgi:CheY-like chemotaxis protein/anti-sigma regulatory factor (Ser/Thr protein kinase)
VLGDQQRLKQVLINLLSNAIKYNRPGGTVRVSVSSPRPDRVELAIADTGRGMTPEQLERLFEPFDRLGAEQTDVDGIGLGLPLSKRLLDAMGGTIDAESDRGVGTTVRVRLQGAREPEAELGVPTAPLVAGELIDRRTIVYIEDNLTNATLVEGVLAHLPDVRLIPAMQGQLGLELVREYRPDVVLMDLHLPDLDGREVLKRLKADSATADIPVVVLSADATASQVEQLRMAGAADYLTKPIDVERLLAVLAGVVTAPTS